MLDMVSIDRTVVARRRRALASVAGDE